MTPEQKRQKRRIKHRLQREARGALSLKYRFFATPNQLDAAANGIVRRWQANRRKNGKTEQQGTQQPA